jgi:hypothetical protein
MQVVASRSVDVCVWTSDKGDVVTGYDVSQKWQCTQRG